ncbi:MAG: hypothetical protein FWC77_00440 [Defluviitaleaceae bacterium]|nr:hypothetical protein [Defluviitaleaceae bacterium]
MTYKKIKRKANAPARLFKLRIMALFAVLAIVTAIAALAIDGGGDSGIAPTYGYPHYYEYYTENHNEYESTRPENYQYESSPSGYAYYYGGFHGYAPYYLQNNQPYYNQDNGYPGSSGGIVPFYAPTPTPTPDWRRLNYAINVHPAQPDTIVIHPAGAPNMFFDEDILIGSTFHLVITDPNPHPAYFGRTITTLPIYDGMPAPWSDPHRIAIHRHITILAAEGEDIYLRMPVPGSINTALTPPWGVDTPPHGRHFVVYPGGAFYIGTEDNGTLTIDGNAMAVFFPDGERGGVRLEGGHMTMQTGSVIYNNRAEFGGGVYVASGATLNITGEYTTTKITGNYATGGSPWGGGGVFVTGGGSQLNMTGGTISNNTSYNGGGVNLIDGAHFYMHGGVIRDNHAPMHPSAWTYYVYGAGGVRVGADATFEMHDTSVIKNNTTDGGGAGVRVEADATFTMYDGEITHNTAGLSAGGVFANGGTFIMWDGLIMGNTAGNEVFGPFIVRFGGGIDVIGGSSSIIHGGRIYDNRAPYGAGISVRNAGITMEDGYIYNNRYAYSDAGGTGMGTVYEGGGVWVGWNEATYFIMSGGTIGHDDHNMANYAISGGGVWVGSGAWFDMTGGYILSNTADDGGGVDVNGGGAFLPSLFTISNGLIYNNHATDTGGGVRVGAFARFYMSGGTIQYNHAGTRGGGVFAHEGDFGIVSGEVSGPVLPMPFSSRPATPPHRFTMNGEYAQIIENVAGLDNTPMDLTDTQGGGVHVANGASFLMSDGLIADNHALVGGGVFVYNGATFYLYGGNLTRNEARTTTANRGGAAIEAHMWATVYMRQETAIPTLVNYNFSHNHGAINISSSHFYMYDGTISYNGTANLADHGNGGGVAVTSGSLFEMRGGQIINNAGRIGGGVFVHTNSRFNMFEGTLISDNAASHSGGGVGVFSGIDIPSETAAFYMYGGVIENNGGVRQHPIPMQVIPIVNDGSGNPIVDPNFDPSNPVYMYATIVTWRGGGVAVGKFNGRFVMHGGIIRDNHANFICLIEIGHMHPDGEAASGYGGGVAVVEGASFVMTSMAYHEGNAAYAAQIHGNTAEGLGGGVAVSCVETRDSVILDNFPDQERTRSSFVMAGDSIIRDNTALNGGGVGVYMGGVFRMYDDTIYNCLCCNGNIVTIQLTGTPIIRDNIAQSNPDDEGGNGGGIYIAGLVRDTAPLLDTPYSRAFMEGGTVTNNTATAIGSGAPDMVNGGGGGIYVDIHGYLTATDTYITYNQAPTGMGGGIFTERHEYACPLTRVDGSVYPPHEWAYRNLILENITFGGNVAYQLYMQPSNATEAIPVTGFIPSTTSQTPSIQDSMRHPINNYDINYWVEWKDFAFYKTDGRLYEDPYVIQLLAGAQFRLFRYLSFSTPGTDASGLVIIDSNGNQQAGWEEIFFHNNVYTSSDVPGEYISFTMDPRFSYQLVEVVAPAGFQLPFGQWRVTYDGSPDFVVEGIGNSHALEFVRIPSGIGDDVDWFVGNMWDFELPLAGGSGTMLFMMGGGTLLAIGVPLLMYIMFISKKARAIPQ